MKLVSDQVARPMLDPRPSRLNVVIFGFDVVQNSPTADLVYSVFKYWLSSEQGRRYEFFLFAYGPVDETHPPAADIKALFGDRLILFTEKMTARTKLTKIMEKMPHVLLTLTGWTHGHNAEVIAAVGQLGVLVISWLGWAGLMFLRESVHFTVVGRTILSSNQRMELEANRERVAVISCYQPPQGHPGHTSANLGLTRKYFNLPSSDWCFIFVFPGMVNRITRAMFMMWLGIVSRVDNSCLLLLSKPRSMKMRIRRWIKQYNAEAALHFDEYRVLFRSAQ